MKITFEENELLKDDALLTLSDFCSYALMREKTVEVLFSESPDGERSVMFRLTELSKIHKDMKEFMR